MACSCNSGSKGAGPSSFTVKKPDGTTIAYRSKVEAEAAAKRLAGKCVNC